MNKIEFEGYYIVKSRSDLDVSNCVIALGNFDGVHNAHAEILRSAISLKQHISADCVGVWCFGQNPIEYLSSNPPSRLVTVQEKVELLLSYGMDFVVVADFPAFCRVSATDFVDVHLKGELGCIGTVCGYNNRFGYMGQGTPEFLRESFGRVCKGGCVFLPTHLIKL